MSQITEGLRIRGEIIVEEINPKTQEVVSREVGENIICITGAEAMAAALTTGTMTEFNYMIISEDVAAVARASVTLPGTFKYKSTVITPTVTGSITTWVHTFASGGSPVIWKFGMGATDSTAANIWNEYKFSEIGRAHV